MLELQNKGKTGIFQCNYDYNTGLYRQVPNHRKLIEFFINVADNEVDSEEDEEEKADETEQSEVEFGDNQPREVRVGYTYKYSNTKKTMQAYLIPSVLNLKITRHWISKAFG